MIIVLYSLNYACGLIFPFLYLYGDFKPHAKKSVPSQYSEPSVGSGLPDKTSIKAALAERALPELAFDTGVSLSLSSTLENLSKANST